MSNAEENLRLLVDELTKAKPNPEKVKQWMAAVGLPWTDDPLSQMTSVLNSLDSFCKSRQGHKQSGKRKPKGEVSGEQSTL